MELFNAVGTRVKKHELLMFYYVIGNLPKVYHSALHAINLYAVIKTDDVACYGFDVVLQPLLADLQILSIARGHPIQLKNGNTISHQCSFGGLCGR